MSRTSHLSGTGKSGGIIELHHFLKVWGFKIRCQYSVPGPLVSRYAQVGIKWKRILRK